MSHTAHNHTACRRSSQTRDLFELPASAVLQQFLLLLDISFDTVHFSSCQIYFLPQTQTYCLAVATDISQLQGHMPALENQTSNHSLNNCTCEYITEVISPGASKQEGSEIKLCTWTPLGLLG